ncbi:LarC family nickel insertion protein [Azospirillum canadense]|uniref:LarC family nickel insertion protein n=1 Tax=Azospirillum canadense TaxID=403962 RepID=UPI00222763AF|nr:LarC family nickel insertion protein [Azospirillum canadense]MCW2241441.1 uncharacterized protein (TIGR00299 family) protein [Azospirillum canadense]
METGGRHIHLDAVGGVAGDMFVAALLDAFPDLADRVLAEAAAALPAGCGRPALATGQSSGVRALRFGLEESPQATGDHHHDHHHHDHGHHHGAGTFVDMRRRIAATTTPRTADHAIGILTILAEAESRIHDVPVEAVHFHEIADWDSLMDVVAAGSLIAALEERFSPLSWSVSELPTGGGLVRTQHGLLPVPAPATADILAGFHWRDDGIAGERVTPTGAAILRHLRADGERIAGRLAASGTGAGTRTLPGMPNILRALVFERAADKDDAVTEHVAVLSFDIDDMTGEEIAAAADRLRSTDGVFDLILVTGTGKKGRPMHGFRLLLRPDALDRVADLCFLESSTIGLRWRFERRKILPRRILDVERQDTTLRVKEVARPGDVVTRKAENDDLSGRPLAARRDLQRAAEDPAEGDKRNER